MTVVTRSLARTQADANIKEDDALQAKEQPQSKPEKQVQQPTSVSVRKSRRKTQQVPQEDLQALWLFLNTPHSLTGESLLRQTFEEARELLEKLDDTEVRRQADMKNWQFLLSVPREKIQDGPEALDEETKLSLEAELERDTRREMSKILGYNTLVFDLENLREVFVDIFEQEPEKIFLQLRGKTKDHVDRMRYFLSEIGVEIDWQPMIQRSQKSKKRTRTQTDLDEEVAGTASAIISPVQRKRRNTRGGARSSARGGVRKD